MKKIVTSKTFLIYVSSPFYSILKRWFDGDMSSHSQCEAITVEQFTLRKQLDNIILIEVLTEDNIYFLIQQASWNTPTESHNMS